MAPADAAVIRLWLETNLAEASKEGETGLETLREQVKTMGPEVEAEFNKMTGGLEKVATATKKVVNADEEMLKQAKSVQDATLEAEASLAKVTAALDAEEAALHRVAAAEEEAARNASIDLTVAAEGLAGTGDGESGKGGFAGMAGGAIKAEKAMLAIATGHGVGRVGGLLETLTSAAGLASGTGLAIGSIAIATEVMIPKLEEWISKMDGAAAATKRAADELERFNAASAKAQGALTSEQGETAKGTAEMLAGGGERQISAGIATSLGQEPGFGLEPDEAAQLAEINRRIGLGQNMSSFLHIKQRLDAKQQEAITRQTGQTIEGFRRGEPGALAAVGAMAAQQPGEFPPSTAANIQAASPAGRAESKRQSDIALANTAQAERIYADRELVRKNLEETDKQDAANSQTRAAKDLHDKERKSKEVEALVESWSTWAIEQGNHEREHQATEQKRTEAKTRHDAARDTPEHRLRAQEEEQRNAMLATVQGNTHGFSLAQQQQITDAALRDVQIGFTLAAAVQDAVRQMQLKIASDFQKGMQRQQAMTESWLQ
jgi:hypothetical protein